MKSTEDDDFLKKLPNSGILMDDNNDKTNVTYKKNLECDKCGKSFTTPFSFYQHGKIVHEKVKPFICETCDKIFATNGNLQLHNQRNHQGDLVPVPITDEKNQTSNTNSDHFSSSDEEMEDPDSTNETLNSDQEGFPMDDLEQKYPATPEEILLGKVLIRIILYQ